MTTLDLGLATLRSAAGHVSQVSRTIDTRAEEARRMLEAFFAKVAS